MKRFRFSQLVLAVIALFVSALNGKVAAQDYTAFLTAARGFTEVTTLGGISGNGSDCYILTSAENTGLIVGVGAYEAKPAWASTESKALRYKSAGTDPVLDLSNFFTIEKSGGYVGLRNVVYSADMFQTHNDEGFMYVNTFTDKNFDEWSRLTPTFQNGYWLFENGKYPMSSEAQWKGYMGSWTAGRLEVGEPIALNRLNTSGDIAGHYRLFRIARSNLMTLYTAAKREVLLSATPASPADATWLITNPSFETGDATGWTLQYKEANNNEFNTRDYGMTNREGGYLMNVYQKWNDHSVSQVVENVPSGNYTLSAVLCTWEDRTATLSGTTSKSCTTVTAQGVNDQTGTPVSVQVTVGCDQKLTITANSTTDWWSEGHTGNDDYYTQLFYKVDDVRLTCNGVFLNGFAQPLPNDDATLLAPGQWYYYEVEYSMEYLLFGNVNGMVYSTDGEKLMADVTTYAAARELTLPTGRVYFKTTRSDATLRLVPERNIQELGTFTAVALNVDGLPNKVLTIELNADGPGQDGTAKIGQYLASRGYDFIGCSEDFNYNGTLMQPLSGNYSCGAVRETLSASGLSLSMLTNGFRFDTDGLNLIWKNSTCSAANESWTQWESLAKTDCNQYVKKGYRHYDMTVGGQTFDVYILHMDAGDTNATASRELQWRQLAAAINSADAMRPKLIIGDTNSRWTREDITANFMSQLNGNLTASDVWVEFYRGGICPTTDMSDLTNASDPALYGNYEIVDKIIYINPKAANTLQLVPQSFRIEQDYTYGTIDNDGNTKPLGDHKPVVVEFKYIKSGDRIPFALELANNAKDNSTAIANAGGATADVTLSGRTLYKDGAWNTLCLPFDIALDGSPLAGATAKALDAAAMTGTHVELTFGDDVTQLTAGTPYIIKWAGGTDIVNPTFQGVTLNAAAPQTVSFDGGRIQFNGYYDAFDITAADEDIFYLTASNELTATAIDRTLKACRAYFRFTPADGNVKALTFSIHFCPADGIGDTAQEQDPAHMAGPWHDLQGRRVGTRPGQKGLYILDGKKMVIK